MTKLYVKLGEFYRLDDEGLSISQIEVNSITRGKILRNSDNKYSSMEMYDGSTWHDTPEAAVCVELACHGYCKPQLNSFTIAE